MLPEVGEEGQKRLKAAKVLIVGLGGLGSVSAYYLAAAGVGLLKIVDKDHVDLENLNRQLLHHTQDIGAPKTASAYRKLHELNPLCRIEAITEEFREDTMLPLVGDCQIIVDATDNLDARICLNRASLKKRVPFIYGGVDGFSGMVTTFFPGRTACLECLFPDKTASSGKSGVIGPVPGIVAAVQSLQALKIILGLSGLLTNVLWYINGLDMSVKTVRLSQDPECRACGV